MDTFISHSPDETEALGAEWGRAAEAGSVIALSGDLGAGKTQLVKGIAQGLNISHRVHSPTFSLVNIYDGGRLPLYHIDLYRLNSPEQIVAAGLEDYIGTQGLTVIEWAEKWFEPPQSFFREAAVAPTSEVQRRQGCPSRCLWAQIISLNETRRRIIYEDTRD